MCGEELEHERGKYLVILRDEAANLLDVADADTRHKAVDALLAWFCGRETADLEGFAAYVFRGLVRRQLEGAKKRKEKAEAGARGGRATGYCKARIGNQNASKTLANASRTQTERKQTQPIQDTGYGIQDTGYGIQDTGNGILPPPRIPNDDSVGVVGKAHPTLEEVRHTAHSNGYTKEFAEEFFANMEQDGWVIIKDGKTVVVNRVNYAKMMNGRWNFRKRKESTPAKSVYHEANFSNQFASSMTL